MRKQVRRYFIWFAGLLFLQVVVLQQLDLSVWFYPYVLGMLLVLLPKNTPHWLLLVIGFVLGSIGDIFLHSYGAHAFACTLMAFIRPYILNPLSPKDGGVDDIEPNLKSLGLQKYLTYASLLLLIHHFCVFFIEALSFSNFFVLLLQVITSTALSLFIVLVMEYVFNGKK